MAVNPDMEFLDFVDQVLIVFGPTCRLAHLKLASVPSVEVRDVSIKFRSDPNWRPPAKRFRDTRDSAKPNKRRDANG